MSVVILEGINGVGKSSYAHELSAKLGLPICRPFRNGNSDIHWGFGSELEARLKGFDVPVNTHVDDLYVADFLATFKCGAILDRAIPSAIAYGYMREEMDLTMGQKLLDFWQSIIVGAPKVLYVWMTAPHGVVKQRCEGRWAPNKRDFERLDKVYSLAFRAIKLPKKHLNTSTIELADGVEQLCRALKS